MQRITTHHFFVCIVICLLRYYVYIFFLCKLELFWAWPSYTRIPTFKTTTDFLFPILILTHMRHLHYVRVVCCNWSHADSRIFFHFTASSLCKDRLLCWVKTSIACSCRASYRVYRSRCTGKSVSPSPVSFAQLRAYRDAQFCMHLVVENKCVTSTCIYQFSAAVWTLSWSCVWLRLACGLFVVFHTTKKSRRPGLK